jgi:transposase InsO family protein
VPSVSTIWRILRREGLVVAQPQKRLRCSLIRFEAQLPNEMWQADITHWQLAGGQGVEILNMIDDHSRLFVASRAFPATKAADVIAKNSRPYHPQTCGKVERLHQTLKRYLARQAPAKTLSELQAQLDAFAHYYNAIRPHRALGPSTR